MKKGLIWYSLWLKLYIRKKSSWLQIIGMILLVGMVLGIHIPDAANVTAGIVCEDGEYGKIIANSLLKNTDTFKFEQYETQEELCRDVTSGQLECGFVIEDNLDKCFKEGKLKEIITYVATPMASKGETIQEVVYAEVLRAYSDVILKASDKEIYGDTDEARVEKLLERSHYYQNSDAVFRLEIKELDGQYTQKEEEIGEVYPVQGTVGLFIFLIMFLAYGRKFDEKDYAVTKAMKKSDKLLFYGMNCLAAGTLPAIGGLGLIFAGAANRGIVKELMLMLLFLLLCGLWIIIIGNRIKKNTTFIGGLVALVIVNLLICPVVMNWEMYIPAIKYVSLVFPLGIYLCL